MVEIFLSERAIAGLILSAIETYKDECFGSLLGYRTTGQIIVDSVIPTQCAKRKPTEVEPNWNRQRRIADILSDLIHLTHLGYFHSHNQYGNQRAPTCQSPEDKQTMKPMDVDIIIVVNDKKKRQDWIYTQNELHGSIGNYQVKIAGYYKKKNSTIAKYSVKCPYVVGLKKDF